MNFLWGIVIIASGVFVSVYGTKLFRLALAAIGFAIGAILAWWLTGSQPDAMRVIISLVAGGIGAGILYALIRIGTYIAGGVLGLVLSMLIVSWTGLGTNSTMSVIILAAGAGLVGFFGNRFGNTIIILAMSAAGAFQVMYGLSLMFGDKIAPGGTPLDLFREPIALTVFVIIAVISGLGQMQLQARPRIVGGR
jgi:hypothetical protein